MLHKIFTAVIGLVICFQQTDLFAQDKKEFTIRVTHNAKKAQRKKIVSIEWQQILKNYPSIDTTNFKIIDWSSKKEVMYQLAYFGNKVPQQLLLEVDLIPGQIGQYNIIAAPHTPFVSKTYARYVPERKDDFAWENDKIAFRVYGKALEGTNENANGIDVWVKRTDQLVINKRYGLKDYHTDNGDGLDYYHVGLTLGAGNIAPFINDSIYFPKNYQNWEVLDNGPLRTTFKLTYAPWNVAGDLVSMTKTISIDAGSQLSKIAIHLSTISRDSLPVVVGIIKRPGETNHYFNQANGIMAYWEPTDPKFGTTGVGCIFPNTVKAMLNTKEHFLTKFTIKTNSNFSYYTGAAWDRANEITNAKDWYAYLNDYKNKLNTKVNVVIDHLNKTNK
ncbi:DUF4861 family protein [Sediminibacterium sp.]|uniref:DUF4861 family protein n=1 Tax=Sediminibacterium sp. TaxID=1917865 RepID=UPI00273506C3|nr:DUF4861 family protein [Sediminibacterium sp.]MDP3394598.1 DUF4861 family protein [Sediminibacterium sp.]MDP3568433.1 DUF4861 family protein [Sediminibacterium sp.]